MGSPKIYWPRRLIFKLLEELRKYEYLYNLEHTLYHNAQAKNDAYQSILLSLKQCYPQFEGKVCDIKIKMKNLRTQYRKEMRSCLKAAKRGVRVYEPKLYCFSQIDFLRKFNMSGLDAIQNINIITSDSNMKLPDPEPFQPQTSREEEEASDNNQSTEESLDEYMSDTLNSPSHNDLADIDSYYAYDPPSNSSQRKSDQLDRSRLESDDAANDALHSATTALQTVKGELKKNAGDSSFAKYIKQEMMLIGSNKIRSEMRDRIINVIFEYKRKEMRDGHEDR